MKSTLMKSLIFAGLLCPCLTFATDDDAHLQIGTRTESSETVNTIDPQASAPQSEPREEGECCGFFFDNYPPVYYSSSTHWLIAVSAYGDSVELEDGSVWKISSYDGYKALNWRSKDPLMITQNSGWFSKYNYRIVNTNTGSSIQVNLYLGPIKNGEYTRYIIAIDPTYGELMLNDNSHWEMSSYDRRDFYNWALGDAIIIGYNSGWDSTCEGILINVNMNKSLRAKQF